MNQTTSHTDAPHELNVAPPNDSANTATARSAWRRWPIALLWLNAVTLILILSWLGWQQLQLQQQLIDYQQLQADQLQQTQQQLQMEASLNQTMTVQRKNIAQLQQSIETKLLKIEEKSNTAFEQLTQATMRHTAVDWSMEEVQYLLRLANHRLVIERSSQGALMLLKAADELVRAHENIDTDMVRQAIAADMMALQSVAKQDINGVYASLSALIKQSKALAYWPDMVTNQSLVTNIKPEKTAELITTIETDTAFWVWQQIKDFSSEIWWDLRQLIVIRQHTQPLQQLLSPQALLVVSMHIELALSQAQAALLSQQQEFYYASLDQVQKLLHTYYRIDDPAVQAMSEKIHILKQHPVTIDLPDISASMSTFQQYMNLSSRQATKNQINTPIIDASANSLLVQEPQ